MVLKKIYLLSLMTLILVLLAACGQPPAVSEPTPATGGETASGGNGPIKIATDASYAPMEFMDRDQVTGFDIDFLDAVMKEAGIDYEVENVGWDTMLLSVKQGSEYQAGISAISVTEERKESYDFSLPYYESANMIVVKEGSDIQSAADLADKQVAVQAATTADTIMSELMGASNPKLKKFDSNTLAFMELDKGGADAVVADNAIIQEYIKNNPDSKLVGITDSEAFQPEYYAFLMPKGSELKAKLDPAVKAVIDNGAYEEIYEKWFGKKPDLTSLKAEMAK